MNDLTTMMHALQRYPDRVAMWHEAGHAIAAMHYGRKVLSYGLDPLPHCLVNSLFLSKHKKGVLLCAGAAMTEAVYGFEWGGDCTDWKMAEALGDLETFKKEARELVLKYKSEAKYLVEERLGRNTSLNNWEDAPEDHLREMSEDSPLYKECIEAAENAHLSKWAEKLLMRMARFQIKRPAFTAKMGL
jgi:hypothetical protein